MDVFSIAIFQACHKPMGPKWQCPFALLVKIYGHIFPFTDKDGIKVSVQSLTPVHVEFF